MDYAAYPDWLEVSTCMSFGGTVVARFRHVGFTCACVFLPAIFYASATDSHYMYSSIPLLLQSLSCAL